MSTYLMSLLERSAPTVGLRWCSNTAALGNSSGAAGIPIAATANPTWLGSAWSAPSVKAISSSGALGRGVSSTDVRPTPSAVLLHGSGLFLRLVLSVGGYSLNPAETVFSALYAKLRIHCR